MNAPVPLRTQVLWAPFPGPQQAFLDCPVEDVFFGGARGPGKTDSLLAKFLLRADRHREHERGLIVRKSYPELEEIIERTITLFSRLGAVFHVQSKVWRFANGARLKLGFLERDEDAENYHGHEYTTIGVDEICNFPSLRGLDKLRACLRSPAGIVCQFLATGNPGGPGHNLVRFRYIDQAPPMTPFKACAQCEQAYRDDAPRCDCTPAPGASTAYVERVFIPATLNDNPILRDDPQYWRQLVAAAGGDEAILKAWRYGLWNITAGGMFDDLWRVAAPVIEPFPIPQNWIIDRAFDWGDSAPFACVWFAESNGETVKLPNGQTRSWPRGTLFVIGELYGCTGKPNQGLSLSNTEIARRILAREAAMGIAGRVRPGPADTQIFAVNNNGQCIATEMAHAGVRWTEANKGQGSRVNGWSRMRSLLAANTQMDGDHAVPRRTPMERPGLFVFSHCIDTIRTVEPLPRDKRKRDDVDSQSEDHLADAIRYRVLATKATGGGEATPLGGI